MLDITSIPVKGASPVSSLRSRQPVAGVDGKTTPATGNTLPASEPIKVPELPQLEKLSEGLSNFARLLDRELAFRVDEATGKTVVTVLDSETKEVIRQIPSEELVRLASVIAETVPHPFETRA